MRVTRKCAVVLACLALLGNGRPAAADVASEARFFDELGRRAYKAGEYEKALESFQLVQEIAPSPLLLYNIALCAELAGRPDMAFTLYGEYLRGADTDSARRAQAERRAARLKEKLALIEIRSEPPGVVVYVDRKELGAFGVTPTTLALVEGEHRVLLEQNGFAPSGISVVAKTATVTEVSVVLEPLFGELSVKVTPSSATLRFLQGEVAVSAVVDHGSYRLPVGQSMKRASSTWAWSRSATLPAALLVDAGKAKAEVFVDGQRAAVAPATLTEVGVGEHFVQARSGSRAAGRRVRIVEGHALYLRLELPPKP